MSAERRADHSLRTCVRMLFPYLAKKQTMLKLGVHPCAAGLSIPDGYYYSMLCIVQSLLFDTCHDTVACLYICNVQPGV